MIMVIDGNNLAHRVLHTPQGNLTTAQGEPSGVMIGVLKAIRQNLQRFPETTRVIVVWDAKGGSAWRKKLYPAYKGNRDYGNDNEEKKKLYEGLWAQMEESHRMLHMVGVHSIKLDGYEADDLMAGIAYAVTKQNKGHVMIVTSDKDMLQLVSDRVSIYSPYRDKVISPLDFYEETGVTKEAYIGYRALVGDTSDNIMGISGIGEKTAKKLMDEHGHIDNILNAKGDVLKSLMKSKVKSRIFTPEGLQTLGINNKIMNFKHVEFSQDAEDLVNSALGIHFSQAPNGEDVGLEPQVNSKEFKAWLMRWQVVSILADYLTWISPFLALGED
jgi:DNA polymerase I